MPVAPPRAVSGSHRVRPCGCRRRARARHGCGWRQCRGRCRIASWASPREAVWLVVVATGGQARRTSGWRWWPAVGGTHREQQCKGLASRWRPGGRSLPPPRGGRRCGGRTVVPPPWAGVRRLSRGGVVVVALPRGYGLTSVLLGARRRVSAVAGVARQGGVRGRRASLLPCTGLWLSRPFVATGGGCGPRRRRRCLGKARLVVLPGEAVSFRRRLALARAANGRMVDDRAVGHQRCESGILCFRNLEVARG